MKIVPGYGKPQEVVSLFTEYTEMLKAGEPAFREYLEIQHYDEELEHPEQKYAPPAGRLYLVYAEANEAVKAEAAKTDGMTEEVTAEVAAGCIALRRLDAERCEMKRLYVRPAFRGQKLGSRLVEQIIADAREAGYKSMLLDTLPFLKSALALYKAYGFCEIPCYNDSPLSSSIYMKLDL